MNNTCPQCGAVYTVSSKDVGRRIACKKCKSHLIIDETGMRMDSINESVTATSFTPSAEDLPANSNPSIPKTRNSTDLLSMRLGIISDWSAVVFAAGLFLVIVFHFFPRIDLSMATSRDADVQVGQIDDSADQREVDARNNGKPTDADKESRRKRGDDWLKTRAKLEERASLAKYDSARAMPWNYRGQLFGYVLLAIAGVGMLMSDSHSRRVLGGILLLLIFVTVTHSGVSITVGK